MITFDPINLDDDSVDPKDYFEVAKVFNDLAIYALGKKAAMQARFDGNTGIALALESSLDGLYNNLPEWARW